MTGTVTLITGGASGIGAAAARRFHRRGDHVVIVDRDTIRGAAVAEEVGGQFVSADVGEPDDNTRAVETTLDAFGQLDEVVLNAGVPGRCGLHDFTVEGYRDTMRTNLDGVVYGLHACLPRLRRQGHGSILVMAGIAGLTGSPDLFYATGKYALVGLVRSAPAADGIRINALCPGLVDTPALAPHRAALRAHGLQLADPAEIAAAVETVLADPRTGQVWTVQDGQPAAPVPPPEVRLASG
ncbi:SDR family NAD(P)-dependent oxidoreductase [Amycolatopsis balhimycina DSM 5908]|uniref:SDR family NAD(P)-dependent oxidoreductase n=1 Tax=Amycolatopsis balhimycina DSM 5908 TaxID=1081091 RepID=A0A428WTH8_AMYBA|nr:SDR family oxidoreductase [Amycolatopsis balhimycina]RSM46383.1 SDR family NAD(P)-dependent oxidoreductase [Amycolatopsis balhimycina DSM 5908]